MRSRAHLLLELYQIGAGVSDTTTGLMLLAAPIWTLHLMHINAIPSQPGTISFIGAFVLGVGLSYLWVELRNWRGLRTADEWEAQWRCTTLIRACVAIFLFVQIATTRMEPAWALVAISDGVLALIQWIGLQQRWLRSGRTSHVA